MLQLASSKSGGATLKKKRSTSRRRGNTGSSVGEGQDVETDGELSPGPYEARHFAPPGTSAAASASAISFMGTRSSVKDFNGSASHVDINLAEAPPLPLLSSSAKELDSREKIKLLKKARKLSKMLSEIAIPSSPPSPSQEERNFGILQSAQRSPLTPTGTDALSSISTVSRTRAATPSLAHAGKAASRSETPCEDFPYTSFASPPPLPSYSSTHLASESVPSAEGDPERQLVHLGRYLKENMPTELVLRSSSPMGGRTTPATSVSARRKSKRRLSLDLSSLIASGQSLVSPTEPEAPRDPPESSKEAAAHVIKRSRSLWATRTLKSKSSVEDMKAGSESFDERDQIYQDLRSTRSGSLLSEKQRALNVKRARKMAQLFGSEPPPALFQITNINASDDAVSQLSPITESNRDSIASTLLSINPTDIIPTTPNSPQTTPRERRRPHSIASIISVLPQAQPSPAPSDSFLNAELTPTNPPRTPSLFSVPAEPGAHPGRRPSSSHSSRHTARSSSESDIILPSSSFRQRRLRAAKLSRFFGVDLQELGPDVGSSQAQVARSGLSRSTSLSAHAEVESRSREALLEPSESETHGSGMEVDVKVVGRPGLFNWGLSQQRNVDAGDVRVKLRQMKAAH